MLTKGNFTRDEWNRSSSFVQYQPFQLHLLHQEFQLDKPLQNGEEDTKSKRRDSCVQVMNVSSFFLVTSSSAASSPIASKSPGMPTASGKPDSRMSVEPSSLDAASTSQVRLKDAYLGGLMEGQRETPSHPEEEYSEDSVILRLEHGTTKRNLLPKQ